MQEPEEQNKENSVIEIDPVGEVAGEGILGGVGEVLGQAGEAIGGVLGDLPIDVDISV